MSTIKKRVNLTLEKDFFKYLENLSIKRNKPVSTLSLELIKTALELEEDRYFSKIGDERLKKNSKTISHKKVWK